LLKELDMHLVASTLCLDSAPGPRVAVISADGGRMLQLAHWVELAGGITELYDDAEADAAYAHADLVIADADAGPTGAAARLARRLVASVGARGGSVVLLVGDDSAEHVDALEAGADDVLDASAPGAELAARVRAHVRRARAALDLRSASLIDALTGVYNRRGVERLLVHEVERARRGGHELAVVFVDLDGFKAINDRHGHEAGDEALRTFARELAATARAGDVVARLGGDEFLVVLPRTSAAGARIFAERIATAAQRAGAAWPDVQLGASLGVAAIDPSRPGAAAPDIGDLIAAADHAMYLDKRQRNLVRRRAPRRGGLRLVAAP
jgi:two-component system cell cycle response regulator